MNALIWNCVQVSLLILLCILSVMDIRTKRLNLFLLLGPLPVYFLLVLCVRGDVMSSILGCIIAIGGFTVVWWLTRGQIGMGDCLLFGLTGCVLGLQKNILLILLSFGIAFVVAAVLLVLHKVERQSKLPFAPCVLLAYILLCLPVS